MNTWNRRNFLTTTASLAIMSSRACAKNWSQWRGPSRDGMVDQTYPWPKTLDENTLNLVWEKPFGPSYSGPIVHNETVFVLSLIHI